MLPLSTFLWLLDLPGEHHSHFRTIIDEFSSYTIAKLNFSTITSWNSSESSLQIIHCGEPLSTYCCLEWTLNFMQLSNWHPRMSTRVDLQSILCPWLAALAWNQYHVNSENGAMEIWKKFTDQPGLCAMLFVYGSIWGVVHEVSYCL